MAIQMKGTEQYFPLVSTAFYAEQGGSNFRV